MPGNQVRSPDTSIVVVTYNNCDDIDACLRSLQEHSLEAEIIVVDNLSSDGTLEHIRRTYPTVRAVSAGRNGGFGAGINLGASLATGTYLAVINPDTQVQAGWLPPLIDALQYPDVGLVTPTILLMGTEDRVNACGNDVHLTGLAFCAGLGQPAPSMDAANRPVAAVSGAAFMLRRSLWEELGGFDERFFMYLEDTDLSLRARRLGYEILHVPASRIWHRYEVQVSATKLYHLELNRMRLLRKNLSPVTLVWLAPALVLTEAIVWSFCACRGRTFLRAKWNSQLRLWREDRASEEDRYRPLPSRHTDHALLTTTKAHLAVAQLQAGPIVTIANGLLTAWYIACRIMMLTHTGNTMLARIIVQFRRDRA